MSEESPVAQLEKLLNTPIHGNAQKHFSTDPVHKTGLVSSSRRESIEKYSNGTRAEINDIIKRLSSRRSSTAASNKGFERRTKSLERLSDGKRGEEEEKVSKMGTRGKNGHRDYDVKLKSSVSGEIGRGASERMTGTKGGNHGKEIVKRLLTPDDIRPRSQSNSKKTTAIPITAVWPDENERGNNAINANNSNNAALFRRGRSEMGTRRREGNSTDSSPAIMSSSISPGPSVLLNDSPPFSPPSPNSKSIKSLLLKSPKVAIKDLWNRIKSPKSPKVSLSTPVQYSPSIPLPYSSTIPFPDSNRMNSNLPSNPSSSFGLDGIASSRNLSLSKSLSQSNISINNPTGIPSLTPEKNSSTTPIKVIIREDCSNSTNPSSASPNSLLLVSNGNGNKNGMAEEFIVHDDNSWEELLLKRILVMKSRSRQSSTTNTPARMELMNFQEKNETNQSFQNHSSCSTPQFDASIASLFTPSTPSVALSTPSTIKSELSSSIVNKKELEEFAKRSIENVLKEAGLELKDLKNLKNINKQDCQGRNSPKEICNNPSDSNDAESKIVKNQEMEKEIDIYADLKSLSCPLTKEARRISIIKEFEMSPQDLDSLYSNNSSAEDENDKDDAIPNFIPSNKNQNGHVERRDGLEKQTKFKSPNDNSRNNFGETLVDLEQPSINIPLTRSIRRTGSSPNHHWFLGDQNGHGSNNPHSASQATLMSPPSTTAMSLSNLFLGEHIGNGNRMINDIESVKEDLLGIKNTIIEDNDKMIYQNYKDCMRTTRTMLPVSFEELLMMMRQVPIISASSDSDNFGDQDGNISSDAHHSYSKANINDPSCLFLLPLNGMTIPKWLENGIRMRIGRELISSSEWLLFKTRVISRVHAEIFHDICDYYINDVGSKSGTWINGQRLAMQDKISPPRRISHGDIIQFGIDHDRYNPDMEIRCVQVMALIGYPTIQINSFSSHNAIMNGIESSVENQKRKKSPHDQLFRKSPIEITMPVERLNKLSKELMEFKPRLSSANCRMLIKFGDIVNETSSGYAIFIRPDGEPSYSFVFNNYKFNWYSILVYILLLSIINFNFREIAMTKEADGQVLLLNLIRNSTQIYQIKYNGGMVDGDDCCRLVSNGRYKVIMEPKPREDENDENEGASGEGNNNDRSPDENSAPFFSLTGDLSNGKLFIIQRFRNTRRQVYLGEGQIAGMRTKWGRKRYYFEARFDEHSKYDDLLSMTILYFILQQLHTV